MTLEEFYRKPIDSPYISNTHRVYRKYDLKVGTYIAFSKMEITIFQKKLPTFICCLMYS